MRVLVCDDHALLASSLALHLQRHRHQTTVATHPADAAAALRSAHFDVCLLDLRFGHDPIAGLTALPSLREASPGTAVIVLSAVRDAGVARAALHAGAQAVADKGMSLSAVERLVAEAGAGLLPAQLRPSADVSSGRITKREREVLDLVGRGLRSDEIGCALGISAHTVRSHVEAARGKLAARNRLEAVAAMTWSGSAEA
jgi:DNA-binding NarL/FixJ family response regulator